MPDKFNHAEYAKRLRHLRVNILHMSVKEFATLAGVSVTTVKQHEAMDFMPTAYILINFCRAFGVSADWLLGLKGEIR